MPPPLSRIVVITRPSRVFVEITIDPGVAAGGDGVLGVDEDIEEGLLQQERIAQDKDCSRLVRLVADEIDARARERSTAAGHDARQHALDAQAPANLALGAGERQQVLDDFRRAIGFAIDSPKLSTEHGRTFQAPRRQPAAARGGRARPEADC